jgi:hypothetical protein
MVSVARMCGEAALLGWDEVAAVVAWAGQAGLMAYVP